MFHNVHTPLPLTYFLILPTSIVFFYSLCYNHLGRR
nr:MAG TPA: hypothetical protein [Caudoviricetes sp.]